MSVMQRLERFAFSMLLVPALSIAHFFTTGFTVANRTGQTLLLTPIGRFNRDGQRGLLPVVASPNWPMYLDTGCRLRVESGQSIEIFYDRDGVRLSELVVETEEGHPGQLVTPTVPFAPAPHYEIMDLRAVEALSPEVQAAFAWAVEPRRPSLLVRWFLILLLPLLFVLFAGCLVFLLPCLVVGWMAKGRVSGSKES